MLGVSQGKEAWHVFQPSESGSNVANNVPRRRPHVSFVVCPPLFPCDTERLARESRANHVRKSAILASGTGLHELTHVSEDRGDGQESVCDSGSEDALAVVVPFHIADALPTQKMMRSKQPAARAAE
jgi:hypothetical protein